MLPEDGFDAAHAAETPFVMDESVDELALSGIGRLMLLMILGGELGEILGGFVEHDLLPGVGSWYSVKARAGGTVARNSNTSYASIAASTEDEGATAILSVNGTKTGFS